MWENNDRWSSCPYLEVMIQNGIQQTWSLSLWPSVRQSTGSLINWYQIRCQIPHDENEKDISWKRQHGSQSSIVCKKKRLKELQHLQHQPLKPCILRFSQPQNLTFQNASRLAVSEFGRDSYKPDECRQCQQMGHLCVRPLGQAVWDEYGLLAAESAFKKKTRFIRDSWVCLVE